MIKLKLNEPYVNENRLRNVATVVVNFLWKSALIPYHRVRAIRELIQKEPQNAIHELCSELISFANSTRNNERKQPNGI